MDAVFDEGRFRGLTVLSFTSGLLGLFLCWWFPFGLFLSSLGLMAAACCCAVGFLRTRAVDRFAAGGVLLCGAGATAGVLLGYGSWLRLLGL